MPLPVLFGANVDPLALPGGRSLRQATLIDRLGLDLLTIQDHPYQSAFDDTWTLLTFLAARTSSVTLVPTVSCLPLRPPAVLAKAAATLLDRLSGSRVQLGLGAGAFWDAIAAMGGPRRTPAEAVAALEEAIGVIRAMWSGDRSVRVPGEHYALAGVHPGPAPGEALGLWLGSYGPRTLALTGARADGWLPSHAYLGLDALPAAVARLDAAAEDAGRDPASLRKVYNIAGRVSGTSSATFDEPADVWAERIVELVTEVGMNGFVLWPLDDHERQYALFAEEVVPAVRASLPR
ncbi:alkanesulfonate monooxygenase SsuD/methylene tetrahydromethanopterin reductase-like flavin-dependent oxidoreductase (luciferase family) [Amycolatopsis bartoniae]|uniref:N5,N10-methylene tetrahydromethanopterin reductase n=1 Tax=Amycolatopsis bartoniae TaxID=941986 RepID=A0A8H9IYT2_9PSEU|nr:LLM class flavin-dependent oxidoreductase [Amycolatopsis bartoniae]MBB2938474.1 alkanesulfonate monooxygenase SsuD/methylene tetrahydromethanopterin reductase-like flavin-dependent oxidoreductase (luciferase family) [Amycolatopsis bartoniae]TVT10374.1 LLM class flavin-dependent oxidoreductase [Amycolatopsis bartoniae]GHF70748.1 N5,N10-methylene tetrahydromethanopterin reductase [Amycolatopsis bartoniae]